MRIWKNEFLSHSWADETDLIVPWPISLLIYSVRFSCLKGTLSYPRGRDGILTDSFRGLFENLTSIDTSAL